MKVMVVSPHPDDETLGAGGTLLKYKELGHEIYWLNITNVREEYGYSLEKVNKRNYEINSVNNSYIFDGFYNIELEPAGLDKYSMSELICKTSEVINLIKPDIIILPYRYDIHSDHKIVFDCLFSCTKSFRYPSIKMVLSMEIPSETDFASPENSFAPNYYVDISEQLDKKIEIMKTYDNEMDIHPFPRSIQNIKALATVRGATAGVKYAEAFMLIKAVV